MDTAELTRRRQWVDRLDQNSTTQQARLQGASVRVKVKTLDYGAWFGRLQKAILNWQSVGSEDKLHAFYRQLAANETVKPRGEVSPTNWHRYGDKISMPF